MRSVNRSLALAGIFTALSAHAQEPDTIAVEVNSAANMRLVTLQDTISHPSYLKGQQRRWHGETELRDSAVGLSCLYNIDGFVDETEMDGQTGYGEAYGALVTNTPCESIAVSPNDGQSLKQGEIEIGNGLVYNVANRSDGAIVESFKDPTVYSEGFGTIFERIWSKDGTVSISYMAYTESNQISAVNDEGEGRYTTTLVKGSTIYAPDNLYYWQITQMVGRAEFAP